MTREDIQDVVAVLDASPRGKDVAEDDLRAAVVQRGTEHEYVLAALRLVGPSRQRARDFLNVLLGISPSTPRVRSFMSLRALVLVQSILRAQIVVEIDNIAGECAVALSGSLKLPNARGRMTPRSHATVVTRSGTLPE